MLKVERAVRGYLLRQVEEICAASGRRPWFLQIGANDSATDDPLHELIRHRGWRGALVEPNPAAFARLRANTADIEGLRLFCCAASDRAGEADFVVPANDRLASLDRPRGPGAGPPLRVRIATLEELLAEAALPALDVLVTDAEGHDARILAPLDLSRFRPLLVVFESHHHTPEENAALRAKFEAAGYAVMRMHADSFAARPEVVSPALARLLEQAHEAAAGAAQRAKRAEALVGRALGATAEPKPAQAPGEACRTPASQPMGPAEPAANPLRDWYFCVNEDGLARGFPLIQAAVLTARKNTTLRPRCVYDGGERPELEWLHGEGVDVIRHRPMLESELRLGYGDRYDTFRGHWLRLDLPEIVTDAEQVLYTDIDVIFLDDPRRHTFSPRYLAVCEEAELGGRDHFNSGVMVMNLPALRAVRPWLVSAIRQRIASGLRYPPHDQKSLNDFFLPEVDWMSPVFNWKPYWGMRADAVIVHFHGPKPAHVERIRAGRAEGIKPGLVSLYGRAPDAYDAYLALFQAFRQRASRSG
jgi:FkbM family methyltransferase